MRCGHISGRKKIKNKVHYSPEAMKDLDDIWLYIVLDLGNPDAAINVVNKIMDTANRLEDFALTGTLLSFVVDVESDYRFL